MNQSIRIWAAVCSVFVASAAWAAGKTAVMPVRVVNLDDGAAQAIGLVLAGKYAQASGREVTNVDGQASDPVSAALGADEVLEPTAIGLGGDKIVLQVIRKSADGKVLQRVEATAASLSEVDEVSNRLAAALARNVGVLEARTPDNVLAAESRRTKRVNSDRVWGIRTGIAQAFARGREVNPVANIGFDWRYEGKKYFLEWGVGLLLPAGSDDFAISYGAITTEIGASRYLTDGNIAPYVGGGLMPRILLGDDIQTHVNFAPYAQVGVMFFRESSTRLYGEIRAAQNVLPWVNRTYPTELGFHIGIGW